MYRSIPESPAEKHPSSITECTLDELQFNFVESPSSNMVQKTVISKLLSFYYYYYNYYLHSYVSKIKKKSDNVCCLTLPEIKMFIK